MYFVRDLFLDIIYGWISHTFLGHVIDIMFSSYIRVMYIYTRVCMLHTIHTYVHKYRFTLTGHRYYIHVDILCVVAVDVVNRRI